MEKKDMEFEFNEKIMTALMKKVKVSDAKVEELEQNISVKEAELQYLAKLYDEQTKSLKKELEEEKSKNEKIEFELNKYKDDVNKYKEEIPKKDEEISDLTSKLQKLTNELKETMTKINDQEKIISQQDTKIQEMTKEIDNKNLIIKEQSTHFEALEAELKEYKGPEIDASDSEGERVKCSKCGSVGKDIKIVEDKTKPLSYVGNMPMYAKVHVCKKCGYQF